MFVVESDETSVLPFQRDCDRVNQCFDKPLPEGEATLYRYRFCHQFCLITQEFLQESTQSLIQQLTCQYKQFWNKASLEISIGKTWFNTPLLSQTLTCLPEKLTDQS